MGTTQQTVVVHTAEAEEIKARLVRWLSVKGFETTTGPALFGRDREEDDERGLCLFSNQSRVIIQYSHMFPEGERLRFELTQLGWPVLNIWTFDSDIWGYHLFENGEPVADFCSNPGYFGHMTVAEELPPGVTADPEVLCRVFELGPMEQAIGKLQRGRALFKEILCCRFCRTIGVEPAGYGYESVEGLPAPLSVTAGEWRVDHIRFKRRGSSEIDRVQPLHAMVWKAPRELPPEGELPPGLSAYLWGLRLAIWLIGKPLGWMFGLWFRSRIWLGQPGFPGWRGESLGEEEEQNPLTVLGRHLPTILRREGNTLINNNHRCQIDILPGMKLSEGLEHWSWVFRFEVFDQEVCCNAVRPRHMQQAFGRTHYMEISEEELFYVGPLQARAWVAVVEYDEKRSEDYTVIVQTAKAFYVFMMGSATAGNVQARQLLRKVVETFRAF